MADPAKIDVGDWLGIGGLAVTVVGSVVGGVKAMLGKRDDRLTALEQGHHDQVTQLAVLKTCQENIHFRLDEIKQEIQVSAENGADRVNDKFAQVLEAIKTSRGDSRRNQGG